MKGIARYCISHGMLGYMPNDVWHCEASSRRELAQTIRDALAMYEMPASLFKEVHIRDLWFFIDRHGSSVQHFYLRHKNMVLQFSGMTDEEWENHAKQEAA